MKVYECYFIVINVAINDTITIPEDTTVVTLCVALNDTDPDLDPLTVSSIIACAPMNRENGVTELMNNKRIASH